MRRVPEVPEVDEPDEDTDDADHLCEQVAKVIQLALQGGLFADLRRDGLVNIANSCTLAGVHDDGACAAVDDGRSGEEHVDHVLLDGLEIWDCFGGLVDGGGFACEDGLVDAEAAGGDGEEATVGRDLVSYGDGDDVAGDEL